MLIEKWNGSIKDKEKIIELFQIVFGDNEFSSKEYFEWIYQKNPQGDPIIVLAKEEKTHSVIGVETIIPMNIWINCRRIKSSLSCNSVVHPDYRNQGIFGKLVDEIQKIAKDEKFECIFGVPNPNSYHVFMNQGFSELGKLKIFGKPFKISEYFGNKSVLKPLDLLIKREQNFTQTESFKEKFDSKYDRFFNEKINQDGIMTAKNKDFLNWRYKNHPTREYETYNLIEKNELLSYIIIRKTMFQNKQVAIILDFEINPKINEIKKISDFLISVFNNYREKNMGMIITCNHKSYEYRILKKLGFFTIPKIFKPDPFYFIFSVLNSSQKERFEKFEKWFISFGDYDVF